jgi:membrane-bound lytic murein transglycosylase A
MTDVHFSGLPGWADDNHLEAFMAFRRSALQALKKPYKDGEAERTFLNFKPVFEAATAASIVNSNDARLFFESYFLPVKLKPEYEKSDLESKKSGLESKKSGLVTGFYEPVVKGSRAKTDEFPVPLYSTPGDLVEVTDSNRPEGWDPYFRFALQTTSGLNHYPDRGAIERGYLEGKGLELVFVADKIEAFFIHVQGAARIELPDGNIIGITYSAKSGHPFVGPGRILIDRGEIAEKDISMQSVRRWLKSNPDKMDALLWQNRSFIFFKESPIENPELGPVAAAKVQLQAGRSMAVDRLRHVFGSAFYIVAPLVNFGDGKPFQRLMIAQDTGSAIVGTARGDLFTGSGFEAGEIAGRIKAGADFYLLMPRQVIG